MTAKEAISLILENQHEPALNWAINYAIEAQNMDENSNDFRVQCIYIVNNISKWRAKKGHDNSMKAKIKEARAALKEAGGIK